MKTIPELSKETILSLVRQDQMSRRKRRARAADRYYDGKHDILRHRIFYFNKDGRLVEDVFKSNTRISHPFFTELVEQEVQYLFSGGIEWDVQDQDLKKELEAYFNAEFLAEAKELVRRTAVVGWSYLYQYQGADDRIHFRHADGLGIAEYYADGPHDTEPDAYIHYYPVAAGKGHMALRIEVWDSEKTTYYICGNGKSIELDPNVGMNPCPHLIYESGGKTYVEDLGYIPLFRLDNNAKRISGLEPIKDMIDDYDMMDCGLSNNLKDIADGIYVVKGFKGSDLTELEVNLKGRRTIGVGENGDVEIRTVNIPYEARKAKLELDEKNIYKFGMGFNSAQVGDGNVTNVVIKSRYFLLDLKCGNMETRFRALMEKLIALVVDEINWKTGAGYRPEDVHFEMPRETITNETDTASIAKMEAETKQILVNILLSLKDTVDDESIVRKACEFLDLNYDEVAARLPEQPDNLSLVSQALEGGDEEVPEGS